MPETVERNTAGRLALIVGASSGIGEALALALVRDGWRVVIASRRRDALDAVAAKASVPGRIFAEVVDVTDAEASAEVARRVESEHGEIDTVVLNAGDYEPGGLDELDPGVFARITQVNYLGVVNGLAACLPPMRARRRGQILMTASLSAYRGLPRAAAYGASKAAVLSLAESLRPEAERDGVLLRVINPGFVQSRLTAKNRFHMPQLMTPEAAAEAIVRDIDGRGFEIFFPKRLGWTLKFLRVLPYRVYFALTRRMLE